jgi:hypothetical protein
MSMSQQVAVRQHAEVSQEVFLGVMWTLLSVSLACVLARIGIKLRTFRRLFWDDALVMLAWAMLLTTAILWRYNLHFVYDNYEIVQGKRPFDQNAIRHWDTFMRLIVPFNVLFYTGLWLVKLSFLFFFRSFGTKIHSYETYWWFVLVVTLIAYIGCIADIQYDCTVPAKSVEWVLQNCATQSKIDWVNRTFYANCALDVLTDLLILSIPIIILWNVNIGLRKKVVLSCIFSATVAIMTVAIIRVAVVDSRHQNTEIAWLYFWTFVENGIAIMIACVASFRQLFVASHEQHSGPPFEDASRKSSVRALLKPSFKSSWLSSKWSATDTKHKSSTKRGDSQESISPLEFVTIHNNIESPPKSRIPEI